MSGRTEWMIYGANGYTGHLVAAEARRRDLKPVLAGRRAGPIEKLAAELGLPMRIFGLDDAPAAASAIADMAVVANCAGPFAATSAPMIDACLTSRTHYLDITGEIDVFLAAQRRHADADAAGIVICPGVGFDVIPTDCMAAVLKEALPDASHLVLAFDARGPMSPGTARTMVRSLRLGQHGGRVRRNGVLEEVPLAQSWRRIDFAGGSARAIAVPWGDLATAWFSTGIPNIETYAAVPRAAAIASRALNWVYRERAMRRRSRAGDKRVKSRRKSATVKHRNLPRVSLTMLRICRQLGRAVIGALDARSAIAPLWPHRERQRRTQGQ
jgi:short subunit dehydrogenase-like uncharacterized protein